MDLIEVNLDISVVVPSFFFFFTEFPCGLCRPSDVSRVQTGGAGRGAGTARRRRSGSGSGTARPGGFGTATGTGTASASDGGGAGIGSGSGTATASASDGGGGGIGSGSGTASPGPDACGFRTDPLRSAARPGRRRRRRRRNRPTRSGGFTGLYLVLPYRVSLCARLVWNRSVGWGLGSVLDPISRRFR